MELFEISYAYKFIGGFYFAMSVLHVILFLYNRSRKANLVYAAGMFMVFLNFTFTQQAQLWSGAYKANILTDLAANAALLYYVSNYAIAKALPRLKKALQIFGWLYGAGFLLLVINFQLDIFNTPLETILRSSIYAVIGACCVIGLVKKLANFHLIVLATLFLMVMWVFFGTDIFNFWNGNFPPLRVSFILIGFILPGVAYSYYLSQYLFKTKKNLQLEHLINEQLSLSKIQAEKIRELDQLRSRFFANISHEFRTPLTLILNPLRKRMELASTTDEKTELSVMHRNASRLLTLVNQLLDLSRLEAGTLKLKCTEASLNTAVTEVASQFSSMADSKEIHFQVDSPEMITLYFDHDKLENILTNLLANAFKFTAAGGRISLSLKKHNATENFKNGYAEITVSDTGTGIDAEHLTKIFDRFYQVDMSNTRTYEGSGIGLSLTKELVELHHGTIGVESKPGAGSSFTVRLPLGSHHLKPGEIVSYPDGFIEKENGFFKTHFDDVEAEDQSAQADSILIIEDNVDLRAYIRKELQSSYTILEAIDGEAGVTTAIREVPTLIISDLMMPKKDGLAVCQELKEDERTSHIPLILLTARADIESRLSGLQQGADDYISKPFNLKELQLRIQNLIAARKKWQEKFAQQLTVLPSEIPVESADGRFLKKTVAIIEANLANAGFGVEPLARELAVSQTQLYRKVQALTGSGPNEFIRHIRLLRASELLRNKAGNVSEVAYEVGFNNLSYFAKVFKEKFGVTPSEFEKG